MDGMDYEVREANRRTPSSSIRGRSSANNHEAVASPDGNDTVFSSSTTSSNYHSYIQSPRPLRDGATMPVERFFAGGNIAMSPSPASRIIYPAEGISSDTSSGRNNAAYVGGGVPPPSISKFIALSPKKLPRAAAGVVAGGGGRDSTHSPHTVSSHSVSANSSSSGSENLMKKPLKFVAYTNREERESPFDEPPIAGAAGNRDAANIESSSNSHHHAASLIKPRISKVGNPRQNRPPMIQKPPGNNKPPQSPRKQDIRLSGARTPTRTPPPSSYYKDIHLNSGANTPCSPPVIVDGPNANVLCGDLAMKPKRPSVVRGSSSAAAAALGGSVVSRGMFLIPPSSSYRSQHHPHIPPRPSATVPGGSSASLGSSFRDSLTVMGGTGANNGSQEIVFTANNLSATEEKTASIVSPENKQGGSSFMAESAKLKDERQNVAGDISAVVSPEK